MNITQTSEQSAQSPPNNNKFIASACEPDDEGEYKLKLLANKVANLTLLQATKLSKYLAGRRNEAQKGKT